MTQDTGRALETTEVELTPELETQVKAYLREELDSALPGHTTRIAFYDQLRRDYKARPEHETKTYPWPGASNVVIPLVSIAVDAIVARLMKAVLATQDIVEVKIKSPEWEPMEKDIRDWVSHFFLTAGVRDRLRTVFHDMALCGDAYVKPLWTDKRRTMHSYDAAGDVAEVPIVDYVGPTWDVPAPDDVIVPTDFDEWSALPWYAQILRYTKYDLMKMKKEGGYKNLDKVISSLKPRDDIRHRTAMSSQHTSSDEKPRVAVLYEFTIEVDLTPEPKEGEDSPAPVFEEVICLYHRETDSIVRMIYNPFFGKARFLTKIPYLVQAHELFSMSAAEQARMFQYVASTAMNQQIDAATAANGGIVVKSPDTNIGEKEEVYPGKTITDPNPQNIRVLHLGSPDRSLANIEQQAIRYAETRTGISSYHLGMESTIVGSRATATGTTALINEGNVRFWVSVDDMRAALEQCLYLTIQLIQQYQPEGVELSPGKVVIFPQGDVRTSLGLALKLTSETINKDIEIQNLQVLMQMLQQYYGQLLNASAMIFNPQMPPEQKAAAMAVMSSAHDIMKRFVDRFAVESVDTIVPDLMTILQQSMGAANAAAGTPPQGGPGLGQPPALGPASAPPGIPGGAGEIPPQSA